MTKSTDSQRQTAADQAFNENLNIEDVLGISSHVEWVCL